MRVKNYALALIILLISLPTAFSKIDITTNQNIYNVGNSISVMATLLREDTFDGLLRLDLVCDRHSFQFYLTPISLDKNYRTGIEVPAFKATAQMLGTCLIEGSILEGNSIIEATKSSNFEVSQMLYIFSATETIEAMPSDSINFGGDIKDAFGNVPSGPVLTIDFDDAVYDAYIVNGGYSANIKIPATISTGKHTAKLTAFDMYNNNAEASVVVSVGAIPTTLKIELNKSIVAPGDYVTIFPKILDQHGDQLNRSVKMELNSPKKKIFSKEVAGNAAYDYEASQYDEPGEYSLLGISSNLQDSATFEVLKKQEIHIAYENQSVIIENIGNVLYDEPVEFTLTSKLKTHAIKKQIKLAPGEVIAIDLSKEVESGAYDIIIEHESNSSFLIENRSLGSYQVATEESISDNRPIFKKVGNGLKGITASVVGSDGILARNRILAPLILIGIVIITVLRYAKGKILKIFFKGH